MTSEQVELELLTDIRDRGDSLMQRAGRAMQIARNYRWSQIARRGMSLVRKRFSDDRRVGSISVPATLTFRCPGKLAGVAEIVIDSHRDHPSHQNGDLPKGMLSLLNRSVDTGWPIDWQQDLSGLPHLWRFQLQYHEYLLSFLADTAESNSDFHSLALVEEFLLHWIGEHLPEQVETSSDSWHPYCISRRIPVWLWILGRYEIRGHVMEPVKKCIFQQAEYLCDHLELDLCGNHLFENLTALVLAACCFEGKESRRWLTISLRQLRRELSKQILDHGEHFELSPMYHCQVLGNLLKMACLLDERDHKTAMRFLDSAQRMLNFLARITQPDHEIPLLGDSGYGEAPNPKQIHRLAELASIRFSGARTAVHKTGPYWVFDSLQSKESNWLLFDRGQACCDELPAHGHCDLLNIVASIGGRPWIVDSGNFDYENSSMRRYCRSSIAHNVLTVNNENQCQIWSSFRMGRRARVKYEQNGSRDQFDWASASHNGYRRFGINRMERVVASSSEHNVWVCADLAHGMPTGSLVGYLHFAYDIDVLEIPESDPAKRTLILDDHRQQRQMTFFGTEQTSIVDGWQCPAFGIRKKNPVIVYRQTEAVPRPMGWVLYDMDIELEIAESSTNRLVIKTNQPATTFDWKF